MIIGLAGYAGAGKDAVAEVLQKHHGFRRTAFADGVRELTAAINPIVVGGINGRYLDLVEQHGYEKAKRTFPGVREALQAVGAGVRDHLGESTWIDRCLAKCTDGNWVITDVRYLNEVRAIRARGGSVWWVERPGVWPANDHESEHQVWADTCDLTLENYGTLADLVDKVADTFPQVAAIAV